MGALSKKIEHKDCSKIDQNPEQRNFWSLSENKNKEVEDGFTFYLLIFLLVLIVSSTTNKPVLTFTMPLIQILLGIRWTACRIIISIDTELFLALSNPRSSFARLKEADITSILKHWRIVLCQFSQLSLYQLWAWGLAHDSFGLAYPLAACVAAVGAAFVLPTW